MAIALTSLTSGNDTVNATSFATASISPTGNRLVLALIYNRITSGTANEPTLSGNGITWVKVATENTTTARRLTLFRGMVASPSSGAVTIDFAGQTNIHCIWSICEFSGVDTGGTNGSAAVVQSAQFPAAVATTATATLAAFGNPANATYCGGSYAADEDGSVGSGFTLIHNVRQTENTTSILSEYKLIPDMTADISWTTSSLGMAIAVEVKSATPKQEARLVNGGLANHGLINAGLVTA